MKKLQMAQQLRKAILMFAAGLSEEKAMEIAMVYDPWMVGKVYAAGDFLTYGKNAVGDPQLYKVIQAHTSQQDWTPDIAPALFAAIGLDAAGHPVWSQPAGAHDAYNQGDIVDFQGDLYRCVMDGNTYSPAVYPAGWEKVSV